MSNYLIRTVQNTSIGMLKWQSMGDHVDFLNDPLTRFEKNKLRSIVNPFIMPPWFSQGFDEYSHLHRYCMMIENAGLVRGHKVLDMGGGTGYVSLYCAKKHCVVYHIDIDSHLIRRAKANASRYHISNINYIKATAEHLQFIREEVIDVVFCGEVLEHLSKDNQAIREANRVLKTSGRYIITTPNHNALPYTFLRAIPFRLRVLIFKLFKVNIKYHGEIIAEKPCEKDHLAHRRYGYRRKELELKLTLNGFEIEKSKGLGFLMPRLFASRIPYTIYKLIYNLGSVLPTIASKHLIVAKKSRKSVRL